MLPELESVTLMDCLPGGSVRADLPSRTELVAARDGVELQLRDGYVLVNFKLGIPLARVVRFRIAGGP